MLDEEPLDALIISTPNDTHCPITLAALEKGLHVLCEKPLALNYAEATENGGSCKGAHQGRDNGTIHLLFSTNDADLSNTC